MDLQQIIKDLISLYPNATHLSLNVDKNELGEISAYVSSTANERIKLVPDPVPPPPDDPIA